MFKRKATLPARPPIPTKEEILDDIKLANASDVAFKLEEEKYSLSSGEDNAATKIGQEPDIDEKANLQSHHEAYFKVASFIQKITQLENCLTTLKTEKDNLKNIEENLLSEISKIEDELRKRSQSALDN